MGCLLLVPIGDNGNEENIVSNFFSTLSYSIIDLVSCLISTSHKLFTDRGFSYSFFENPNTFDTQAFPSGSIRLTGLFAV